MYTFILKNACASYWLDILGGGEYRHFHDIIFLVPDLCWATAKGSLFYQFLKLLQMNWLLSNNVRILSIYYCTFVPLFLESNRECTKSVIGDLGQTFYNEEMLLNWCKPPRFNWNIVESGVKHHKPNQPINDYCRSCHPFGDFLHVLYVYG
jgi:hypothetical protein